MTKPSLRLAVVLMALTSPLLLAQQASSPAAPAKAPAFKAHVLTVPELDALIAKPDQLLFVDVRRPDEVTSIGGFPVYLSVAARRSGQEPRVDPRKTARSSPCRIMPRARQSGGPARRARVSRSRAPSAPKPSRRTAARSRTSRRRQPTVRSKRSGREHHQLHRLQHEVRHEERPDPAALQIPVAEHEPQRAADEHAVYALINVASHS